MKRSKIKNAFFDPREHLAGQDVVFPELSSSDPVIMDFLLLTQANHTIYDYGSFGFWGAVLAGGTTMLADGYRLAFLYCNFSVAC